MRNRFVLIGFLSLLLLNSSAFSQASPSKQQLLMSLKKERSKGAETSAADSIEIRLLQRLSGLYGADDNDSSLILAEEALNLSLSLRLVPGYEESLYRKNIEYWIADSYDLLGKLNLASENFQASIDNSKEALAIWEKEQREKDQAESLAQIGTALTGRGNFSEALEYHFEALKIYEKLKDKRATSVSLSSIGVAYGQLDDLLKSLDYFERALKLAEELGDKRSMSIRMGNIGQVHSRMRNLPKAMWYYLKALKIAEEEGDEESIAFKLLNIGGVYLTMLEEDEKAEEMKEHAKQSYEYLQRSLDLFTKIEHKTGMNGALLSLGNLRKWEKNYKESEQYYKRGLAITQEIGSRLEEADFSEMLSLLYEETGDNKQAFYYYKQYIDITDSIYSAENKEQAILTEANYDHEKKTALQKAEHEKKLLLLEAEHKNKRNVLILISVIAALLLLAGFIVYSIRKNLRVKEEYTRYLLSGQEKERQRISKELHDSVGQNILFIRNQVVKLNHEELIASVDQTLDEVRSISKDLYPNQLEKYGLIAALEALTKKYAESTGVFVSQDLEGFKMALTPEEQISFYRIIQECMTNSMKHADATALRITAVRTNGQIELIVQDDGKGFEKNKLRQMAQKSFGILNLEERVRVMKGKAELETSTGKGTKWTFYIPI